LWYDVSVDLEDHSNLLKEYQNTRAYMYLIDKTDKHANLYLRKGTISDYEVGRDLEYVTGTSPDYTIRHDKDITGGVYIRTDSH
jgi:hypothetical protein